MGALLPAPLSFPASGGRERPLRNMFSLFAAEWPAVVSGDGAPPPPPSACLSKLLVSRLTESREQLAPSGAGLALGNVREPAPCSGASPNGGALVDRLSFDRLQLSRSVLLLPMLLFVSAACDEFRQQAPGPVGAGSSPLMHGCPNDFQNKQRQCLHNSKQSAYSSLRSNLLFGFGRGGRQVLGRALVVLVLVVVGARACARNQHGMAGCARSGHCLGAQSAGSCHASL
jgi:hypothetical protein